MLDYRTAQAVDDEQKKTYLSSKLISICHVNSFLEFPMLNTDYLCISSVSYVSLLLSKNKLNTFYVQLFKYKYNCF